MITIDDIIKSRIEYIPVHLNEIMCSDIQSSKDAIIYEIEKNLKNLNDISSNQILLDTHTYKIYKIYNNTIICKLYDNEVIEDDNIIVVNKQDAK